MADAGPDVDAGPGIDPCREPVAPPPACGSGEFTWQGFFGEPGNLDDALEQKSRRFDRQFHAVNGFATGMNNDLGVADAAHQDAVRQFIEQTDDWDFEASSGLAVADVATFSKSTGAFAGAGVAADAWRYMVLRDQGAACEEVDRAREHLVRDLDGLHLATDITGVEGVIARAFARTDLPGLGPAVTTTPLFDNEGNPLPVEKDNGTWRDDNSGGRYPDHVWEDSASRDQLVGWILGYAAAWEAIRDDPTFTDEQRDRLKADAAAIGRSLMKVGEEGFDLEILDADGRRTFHGILHEGSIDRVYFPAAKNGFNAVLSVGILGAIDYISEDPEVARFFHDEIIGERELHLMSRDELNFVDLGVMSNYSAYHMAFQGGLLATRYICDDATRDVMRQAVQTGLYDRGGDRQPIEQKQSFYDLVFALAKAGTNAWTAGTDVDQTALDNALETLRDYPDPPYFGEMRENCDAAEISSGDCVGLDGTPITLLGDVGRGGKLVAEDPVPIRIRPMSNWYWRSNPYEVNGGPGPGALTPAGDYRVVYWLGRVARR